MSNETKREVFGDLVEELANAYISLDGEGIGEELTNEEKQAYLKDYDNALPDDLPVIPEAVGEYIRWCKGEGGIDNVSDAMDYTYGDVATWLYDERNSDTFARAWLLGVWRVEETGEIVKVEAEK
ncbi:DUF1642 domain-containing protein [Lacticaseibacillus rhamnosus]|uniref:DUF1642 domain-containing protein n=1 Tax=Lacticaseibacillus rhamnosus TaxID=47715 RepID=UPI0029160B7D|nr:DUF1642 domain-containing protein [Lacticaseibacillus rhamnosus]WBM89887.1 hypothetical protein [Lacticaseibacillus phage R3.3]WNX18545.1 DUF1642 domain-containing protein [Lacticaseibacillus rhamnosus]